MDNFLEKKDYYYDLPEELIAQDPLEKRSDSRLLYLNRLTGSLEDNYFKNVISYLHKGDTLVLNNTKVIPARVIGRKKDTHGAVEILLLKRLSDTLWECLAGPGKNARVGQVIEFGEGILSGTIREVLEGGNRVIEFSFEGIFEEILDKLGEMPLPPYITHKLKDKSRYQTVYAKYDGSAAAPTAGLHFTKELLEEIEKKGVNLAYVTLHVGLGTFRPVKEDNILDHKMHSEWFSIDEKTRDLINETKKDNRRVICVGTTSLRAIESGAIKDGELEAANRETDIFIYPGYKFKIADGLITNFHLPESTLLMLISAFSSREIVLNAYRHAIDEKYRFFSFGDSMIII